ncbi:hypothetical protein J7E50_02600 [Pedobacter sp. ISL-68]|uniref:hypothetical protein n=1 Tax=unclassified Pedobacter TaxID=2628915 RepID=UPI001BE5AC7C|nr:MULTISPECIES: hypothetical protein [unclassified Pedobacter]MBT2560111.1 hypothetical protein [Pedobacter sp. ISL-64]MBT2589090.1 hypothetical protein [Pedobacter sp. ISL-68]
MTPNILSAESLREQVRLGNLLARLGFKPLKTSSDEALYLNVLRASEIKPSFTINTRLDIWFDHLTKKSGDIIDFGMAYWVGLDQQQVLEKISLLCLSEPDVQMSRARENLRKRRAIKIPYYHIAETRPLGCNSGITAYLQSQGIWEIALGQLQEICYYVVDEKQRRKDFFAAGWQNENGGWEVRSRNYSGCLGRKGMSFIPGSQSSLVLFEEYTDYLSWIYANRGSGANILVMNSPEFIQAAKCRATKFAEVAVYFSKDHLADEFLASIQKTVS